MLIYEVWGDRENAEARVGPRFWASVAGRLPFTERGPWEKRFWRGKDSTVVFWRQ